MATSCEAIQELLAEHFGETERLSEEERRHLELCPQCCEVAAAENALGLIFAKVLPLGCFAWHVEVVSQDAVGAHMDGGGGKDGGKLGGKGGTDGASASKRRRASDVYTTA